ncbi:MAG: formate dehydrogenase subunit delta [Sneathiellaceae bacterium]
MRDEDLIRMANQIAANFEGYPADEARAGLLDHLRKFWDPRMRAQFTAMAAAQQAALHPMAAAIVGELRQPA